MIGHGQLIGVPSQNMMFTVKGLERLGINCLKSDYVYQSKSFLDSVNLSGTKKKNLRMDELHCSGA